MDNIGYVHGREMADKLLFFLISPFGVNIFILLSTFSVGNKTGHQLVTLEFISLFYFIIVAFLENATIEYSLESVCVCPCLCMCVFAR